MHFFKKLLLLMHFTAFLIVFACITASATGYTQRVTLDEKNTGLTEVFSRIKTQTGYTFTYSEELLSAQKVTIKITDVELGEALAILLAGQPFDYTIINKTIVIRDKKTASLSPKPDLETPPVSGIIRTADGQPLAGVNIVVKGTKRGTVSGADGSFRIEANTGEKLLISSIGFNEKEIIINGNSPITIALEISNSPLDEVQIIAYGQTSARHQPGNISVVKAEEIARQPVQNPLLALQGRVPGLFITQSTGFTGGGIKVLIQGQNSITMGNEPFYVIDGVPYSAQLMPNLGGVTGNSGTNTLTAGNPLNYISPNDIESITVLKDADATAIYGSRGANGAILITTKKGKTGAQQIDINLQHGWGKVTRKVDLLNNTQYLQMRHEGIKNDEVTVGLNDYDLNGSWDTTRNADWQKELLGGTARYTTAAAAVSGGNSSAQYLVGVNYHRETTVFPGDFQDQKAGVHFNLNTLSQNQKFRMQITGNYLADKNEIPNFDLTGTAMRLAPVAPSLYTHQGELNWAPDENGKSTFQNPLSYLYLSYRNRTSNLIGNMVLSYQLPAGFELKTSAGYTNLSSRENTKTPILSRLPENRPNAVRRASFGNNVMNSWIIEPQLLYKHIFGKLRFDGLVGTSIQQNKNEGLQQSASGFRSDEVLEDPRSASTINTTSSTITQQKYYALFSRLNFIFRDKFILNIAGRRDGTSRFGPADRFQTFASSAFAWIFSEENFFKQQIPFVNFGKLKISYGTTGSDQIGDYLFLNTYINTSPGVPFQGIVGIVPTGLTNPYLEWEETKKLNLGLDLSFLDSRITTNINYFRNRSSNQLLYYALPIVTGFNGITRNFPAVVQNSGWELSVNTRNINGRNFVWTTNINFTAPRNKLISFSNLSSSSYASRLIVGQPLNITKVFYSLGVDKQTGEYIFSDKDGNGTNKPDIRTDITKLLTAYPKYYGGFGNNFRYKNIELDLLIQFTVQKGVNSKYGYNLPGVFQGGYGNQPVEVLNRWTAPGDIASHQRFSADYRVGEQFGYLQGSDAVYSNASYARLKNISLAWYLPQTVLNKVGIKQFKVFIQGQNLLTITNYKGLDPETLSNDNLPPLRVLTGGLQLSL